MIKSALTAAALSLGLALAVAPAHAQVPAATYKLDPTHASVTWKVMHMGLANYTARFTKIDATIEYDPANKAQSKVSVTIDPTSLKTDYPFPEKTDFDTKLSMGEDWLNAGEHKTITFTSTAVEMTGEKTGKVTGDLTFLGVTKPVVLDVVLNGEIEHPMTKKPALGFSASGTLKRSDFGMTKFVPMVADDVHLVIETEFLAE
jgi:polyisoprenoid-binding protein YceI